MSIASELNGFTHLKHLDYGEYEFGEESDPSRDKDIFASQVRNLFEAVPGLVTITNACALNQPDTVPKIKRGENEQVASVEVGNRRGMKIGYEDLAFPYFRTHRVTPPKNRPTFKAKNQTSIRR